MARIKISSGGADGAGADGADGAGACARHADGPPRRALRRPARWALAGGRALLTRRAPDHASPATRAASQSAPGVSRGISPPPPACWPSPCRPATPSSTNISSMARIARTTTPSTPPTSTASPATLYYRFYAWMRGLDDLSRWRNLCVAADSQPARCAASPPLSGVALPIPNGASQRVTAALQQPETPVTLDLSLSDGDPVALTIDRNDHVILITQTDPAHAHARDSQRFLPDRPRRHLAARRDDARPADPRPALGARFARRRLGHRGGDWLGVGARPHPLTPSPARRGGTAYPSPRRRASWPRGERNEAPGAGSGFPLRP